MKPKKTGFQSVEEYMATLPQDIQNILSQLRATVKAAVPEAKEKVSYQIGAFELNGKNLLYFAGWKNHISVYPIPAGDTAFNKEIAAYIDGKGTLKFPLNKPFPLDLIEKIVVQAAENLKKS